MDQSRVKLEKVYEQLKPYTPEYALRISPCISDKETLAYRCKCSFQMVRNNDGRFDFAVRKQGIPVIIDDFPVANERIQRVMKGFISMLNDDATIDTVFRNNLSSITFSSSWSNEGDCVVACNYDSLILDPTQWKQQALKVCHELGLSHLLCRSRKCVLSAFDHDAILRDRIFIQVAGDNDDEWKVLFGDAGHIGRGIPVDYEKPESAFYHPNVRAMLKALQWQLERMSRISRQISTRKLRLLELYCGCGAHTVALAKSGMFESIVAVELDQRLVEKARRNVQLNELENISIVSNDAALWAEKNSNALFDVILVDPPRQGLAESVCKMVINASTCDNMLYISCGYEALVRDLQILATAFDVIDCTIVDLFPTMEGVESLVHLHRRKTI
ncbi:hypothetical protein MPSEU_000258600 [Mayamaea pseudoterrestris]|nr:hypothetical protein MPSEU_000258600 [Mayamaea pseudoterrestris]